MSARDEDGTGAGGGATRPGADTGHDTGHDTGQDTGHDVGSLAEEAARLLAAFSHLDLEGHLATGAPECTVCPVCRTVRALRGLGPEVTGHLAAAATSLAQALAAVLASHGQPGRGSSRQDPGVEHIDLDDDADIDGWTDDDS